LFFGDSTKWREDNRYSEIREKKGTDITVDKTRAWAIARGERATLGPFKPNYNPDSDLYVNIEMQIERIGLEIYDEFKRRG